MLTYVVDDSNLFKRILTVDKTWLFGYDIQTMVYSFQRKLFKEPRTEKAQQVQSNVKILVNGLSVHFTKETI